MQVKTTNSILYGSMKNNLTGTKWHLKNKMPKKPTLEQRIEWHKEHAKFCSCRPIPSTLIPYLLNK